MMKSRIFNLKAALLLFLIPLAPAGIFAQGTNPVLNFKHTEEFADSLAEAAIVSEASPGLSIAVGLDGKVVFSRGYGHAKVADKIPAGTETVYGITSITKQFTAAAILKLMEQGKIALDEPITTYLPDFPVQGHQVSIRHLLNHTSGTPAMRSTDAIEDRNWFSRDLSFQEMLDYFGHQPFEFEPGQKHAYNNFAFYLLGEIISRQSGKPWEVYMEEALFQPLGLDQTGTCDAGSMPPNGATTYLKGKDSFIPAPKMSKYVLGASGALCSTVEDLIRWNHLLHNGQVISPSSLKLMTEPTVLINGDTISEGLGLYLGELGDYTRISHGGTLPGGHFYPTIPNRICLSRC